MSQSIPGKPVFPALPRLSSRGSTHTTVARGTDLWDSLVVKPRGKASWESLVGKPIGKATDPLIHAKGSVTLLLQVGRKCTCMSPLETSTDSPGETPEVPQDRCQHWRRILRFWHRLTQGLRPRHRRESNPERPPSNSHGHWPFLRPPERVPEVPVVSRVHLQQFEKIQEVLPSRRDEAHFC